MLIKIKRLKILVTLGGGLVVVTGEGAQSGFQVFGQALFLYLGTEDTGVIVL